MTGEFGGPSAADMGIASTAADSETRDLTKELTAKFKGCSFLVVEDDPRYNRAIMDALNTRRETPTEAEDLGIGLATNVVQIDSALQKLIENPTRGTNDKILVIEDMQIPLTDDEFDMADPQGGLQAMEKIVQIIKTWNDEHPNETALQLEIVINSTIIQPEQIDELNERLGGDYIKAVATPLQGGDRKKEDVVLDIEKLFKKQLSG